MAPESLAASGATSVAAQPSGVLGLDTSMAPESLASAGATSVAAQPSGFPAAPDAVKNEAGHGSGARTEQAAAASKKDGAGKGDGGLKESLVRNEDEGAEEEEAEEEELEEGEDGEEEELEVEVEDEVDPDAETEKENNKSRALSPVEEQRLSVEGSDSRRSSRSYDSGSDSGSGSASSIFDSVAHAAAVARADFEEPVSPQAFDEAAEQKDPIRVAPGAILLPGGRKNVFERLHAEHDEKLDKIKKSQEQKSKAEEEEISKHLQTIGNHFRVAPASDVNQVCANLHGDYNTLQSGLVAKREQLEKKRAKTASRNLYDMTEEELETDHKGLELYEQAYDPERRKMKKDIRAEADLRKKKADELKALKKENLHVKAAKRIDADEVEEVVDGACTRLFEEHKKRKKVLDKKRAAKTKEDDITQPLHPQHMQFVHKDVQSGAWKKAVERLYHGWKSREMHMQMLGARCSPRSQRLRKFGADHRAGTERFNLLYGDAFRRQQDRRVEVERQEHLRQRKDMLVSVHSAAQMRPWSKSDIEAVSTRMHAPRRNHTTWQAVSNPEESLGRYLFGESDSDSDSAASPASVGKSASQPALTREATSDPVQQRFRTTAVAARKAVQEIKGMLKTPTHMPFEEQREEASLQMQICSCGAVLTEDSLFCRRCGEKRKEDADDADVASDMDGFENTESPDVCFSPRNRDGARPTLVRVLDSDDSEPEVVSASESELSEPILAPTEVMRLVNMVRLKNGYKEDQQTPSTAVPSPTAMRSPAYPSQASPSSPSERSSDRFSPAQQRAKSSPAYPSQFPPPSPASSSLWEPVRESVHASRQNSKEKAALCVYCGNQFMDDASSCRNCGKKRKEEPAKKASAKSKGSAGPAKAKNGNASKGGAMKSTPSDATKRVVIQRKTTATIK